MASRASVLFARRFFHLYAGAGHVRQVSFPGSWLCAMVAVLGRRPSYTPRPENVRLGGTWLPVRLQRPAPSADQQLAPMEARPRSECCAIQGARLERWHAGSSTSKRYGNDICAPSVGRMSHSGPHMAAQGRFRRTSDLSRVRCLACQIVLKRGCWAGERDPLAEGQRSSGDGGQGEQPFPPPSRYGVVPRS